MKLTGKADFYLKKTLSLTSLTNLQRSFVILLMAGWCRLFMLQNIRRQSFQRGLPVTNWGLPAHSSLFCIRTIRCLVSAILS